MFIILTYDVSTARLTKVAKICQNYGLRVQNSVFELEISQKQLVELKSKLLSIIKEDDSVRIYKVNVGITKSVEILGRQNSQELSKNNAFLL